MLIRQQLLTEELHSCSLRQLWLMINQYTEVINPDTNTHARTHIQTYTSQGLRNMAVLSEMT